MNIFTQTVIKVSLDLGHETGETVFYMRSIPNKEYDSLIANHNLLRSTEKKEKQHNHYVALIKALTVQPPENLPFFNPHKRDLADFLINVSTEELEDVQAEVVKQGNSRLADESQKEFLLDAKRSVAAKIIDGYFEAILDPKRFRRSE